MHEQMVFNDYALYNAWLYQGPVFEKRTFLIDCNDVLVDIRYAYAPIEDEV